MKWSEQLRRIRRWVRDPDGDVFTDDFLLMCYNDEHSAISAILGAGENVYCIRTHPEYDASYTYDWEHYYCSVLGERLYQCWIWEDVAETACAYIWEVETVRGAAEVNVSPGAHYTHPFEAWMTDSCYYPPPIRLPEDCDEIIGLYWDQRELEPVARKEVAEYCSWAWGINSNYPQWYWHDTEIDHVIRIWPLPRITWSDSSPASGDPDNADYAGDESKQVMLGDYYATFDDGFLLFGSSAGIIPAARNIVIIYRTRPVEVETSDDSSNLPDWMRKYVEYGTAEKALRANTDGQLLSLADYWALRRQAGVEALKRYRINRMTDRAVRLRPVAMSGRRRRAARLPDNYPGV